MNFLRKLISAWRPGNFASASTAVLYRTASIVNNLPDASAITIGHNSHIKGELLTFGHGGRIVIGECCYVGEQSRIWSAKEIKIGNRVLIAHNVNIFDNTTHPLGAKERHRQFMSIIAGRHPDRLNLLEAPVIIEDDAWVGCMSIILKGVTIGRGAVIGAGSVVTRDVPPYAVVAGNPASVIRILSDEER